MAIWVVGFGKTKVLVTVELRRKFQKNSFRNGTGLLGPRPMAWLEALSKKARGPLSYKLDQPWWKRLCLTTKAQVSQAQTQPEPKAR